VYSDDYAAHWSASSPEYQWLAADLAAHPSGLKFAFFHYPLYSDQKAQNSDTFLQGPNSLEGLLAQNNVSIAFNGHAHIYERNAPTGQGTFPSYVTGGGGATLQPVAEAGCSAFDAYAIGWSPTKSQGSKCGAAPVPDSASRVFHFLKVSVNGSTVTVAPTDELGRTFDVQNYDFSPPPDTVLDSSPPNPSNSTSASFAFHATVPGATFSCSLDRAALAICQSPTTYSGLADGTHTFTVAASTATGSDPTPATDTWQIDTVVPAVPGTPTASPGDAFATVSWTAPSSHGSSVNGYVVTPYVRTTAQPSVTFNSTATSETVTGLTNGTAYTFKVAAKNAVGTGPESPASNLTIVGAPTAPTAVTASAGSASATVTWTAPSSDNGSPITEYVITPFLNGVAEPPKTYNSTALSEVVTGLHSGQTYTFEVAGGNARGIGTNSDMSNAVAPK
jgi:Fibronectin type III domain